MPQRSSHRVPLQAPRPVGFPGCHDCAYRRVWRPTVCLSCLERSQRPRLDGPGRGLAQCPVCAAPVGGDGRCGNAWCNRADRAFSVVFPVGRYEGTLRTAVVAYKYRGAKWWAGVFARLLAGRLERESTWFEDFELIVAVPGYRGPGARRSWDHLSLVVGALLTAERDIGWEVLPHAVRKVRETRPMTGEHRAERLRLARQELAPSLVVADPAVLEGRRVLVVDDVFTEGATLRAVAQALRRAGAREVAGLVLARALPPDGGHSSAGSDSR